MLNEICGLKEKFLEKIPYFFQWLRKKFSATYYIEENILKLPSLHINRADQSVCLQILTNEFYCFENLAVDSRARIQ